jgi:thiol-disulfide isomerase/thioredoxin
LCLCLAAAPTRAAEAPAQPVLHLLNDGFVAGALRDSSDGSLLRWQSPLFAAPFEFSLAGVNAVHFPAPARDSKPVGDYCFELERGDVLFASLTSQNERELELDVSGIGRVHVQRSSVHRFFRWRDSADVVYLGPHGLAGWKASAADVWREEFGHLTTSQEASIRGDFGLPARAVIEFEISWKKRPDFVLALGVGDDDKTVGQAFRFEVWGTDLVVLRELEREADVAPVVSGVAGSSTSGSSSGRAHLQVYLDQELGRCLVFSVEGSQLADLKVASETPRALGGIRLENKRGDLRLERLRIARWTGDLPREVRTDEPRVHLIDGSIVYGRVTGYDAATRQFVVQGKSGESKISADRLDSAFLSFPTESDPAAARESFRSSAKAAPGKLRGETRPAPARAVLHDGTQLSGDIVKVADGALWINSPAFKEPLRLAVRDLRSVIALRQDSALSGREAGTGKPGDQTDKESEGRLGMLELDGVRLRGRLIDGQEELQASCLVWQPVGSALASALRQGVSGRIVYREPPPPPRQAQQGAQGVGMPRAAVVAKGRTSKTIVSVGTGQRGGQPSLYLRTGDTIPCEVTGIDENGVSFKTSFSDSMFVAHDKIKAVELVRETTNAPGLTKLKRDRLLTLPRMQKDSPPTHLIRSRNGDYLRGRLMGMDANRLQVEVRLEMKEIPRERIARIIWLHAEDLQDPAAAESPAGKPARREERSESSDTERSILRSMKKPTDVDFQNFSLEDALNYLHEYHDVNIVVNTRTLDDESVLQNEVTLKLAGVAFESVLKLLLEPLRLNFLIQDDAVHIIGSAHPVEEESDETVHRTAAGAPRKADSTRTRAQVVRSDGVRLTFFPEKFADSTLSGTSDVLGVCRVNLAQIDQLLMGAAIEQAASELAYQKWKLQNAVEPKFVQAGEGSDGPDEGTESSLVGKPAPVFELDLLAGGKFKLAEQKGHVVVLDFWATWCGPCLAAMPQVDRAVRDFHDQRVQLIAVNLEEAPKPIQSMLERHKLDVTVALDRDGVVAGKYQATAIPQTVVIDEKGKVVRVFIGGGAHLEDQLRDALKGLLSDKSPQKLAP